LKEADGDQAKVLSALLAAVPQPGPETRRRPLGAGRPRVPSTGGFRARRRPPFGPGRGGQVTAEECDEVCLQVYEACMDRTWAEGKDIYDRADECYWEWWTCDWWCGIIV
jgi:hypothetical protein